MVSSFNSAMIFLLFAVITMAVEIKPNLPHGALLESGQILEPGKSLEYGGYTFIMQEDCTLDLYNDNGNRRLVWFTTNKGMDSNCHLKLQHDGNLVIYNGSGKAVWASNTNQNVSGNYILILQEDHNVVIYDKDLHPIWATGTY